MIGSIQNIFIIIQNLKSINMEQITSSLQELKTLEKDLILQQKIIQLTNQIETINKIKYTRQNNSQNTRQNTRQRQYNNTQKFYKEKELLILQKKLDYYKKFREIYSNIKCDRNNVMEIQNQIYEIEKNIREKYYKLIEKEIKEKTRELRKQLKMTESRIETNLLDRKKCLHIDENGKLFDGMSCLMCDGVIRIAS